MKTASPSSSSLPRHAERRGSRSGSTAAAAAKQAALAAAAASKRDPTVEELVGAVESLYSDQLRPYGRIVKKRLEEIAEASGAEAPSSDLSTIQRLCASCLLEGRLAIAMEGESDWSIELPERPQDFVDIYSTEDTFSTEFWSAAEAYFDGLADDEMTKPGGRYECAQNLSALRLPFLEGFTLGQVCHFVQLAMAQKKLLGYYKGAIVPYRRSQTFLKEQCAEQQKLVKVAKMPLATWEFLHGALLQLFVEQRVSGGDDALPLSNIKRYIRAGFRMDLSETALGHASVCDLFKDERLSDVCIVRLRENGYYVHPVESAVDAYQAANPSATLEAENRLQQQQLQAAAPPSPQRRRSSEPYNLPSQLGSSAACPQSGVSILEQLSGCYHHDPCSFSPTRRYSASAISSCLSTLSSSPQSCASALDGSPGSLLGGSGMATSSRSTSSWDVLCSALGMGGAAAPSPTGDASERSPAGGGLAVAAASSSPGDASERVPPALFGLPSMSAPLGDASERVPMMPPPAAASSFHAFSSSPPEAFPEAFPVLPSSGGPSALDGWQPAEALYSASGHAPPTGGFGSTSFTFLDDGEKSDAASSSKGYASASTDVGSSSSSSSSLPGTPRFVAAATPSPFDEDKSFDFDAYFAASPPSEADSDDTEEAEAAAAGNSGTEELLAEKMPTFVHNTFIEVEERRSTEVILRSMRRARSVPRGFCAAR
eukprot:TRINITY_DN13296_c0_g1_i2.p1 TRINITY_DN13296_c0_g1~~TRINITY_DN13296_c0_g1_i2.p1  ORF type:complete len:713 (+),score=206.51 TRINITY_DN13296_c0_g1_i2:93-2231(+)